MVPLTYNIRSLAVRRTTTLATLAGMALVVFVLSAVLMLSEGIRRTFSRAGRRDNAIVMQRGCDNEFWSEIEEAHVMRVLGQPGVLRDAQGEPLGVGELIIAATLERLGAGGEGTDEVANVLVRGVTDRVLTFRPEVHWISGRMARPGTDEAVIGRRLVGRFRGLELGKTFELRRNRPITIVGVFADGGSSFESEIWMDIDALRSTFGRRGTVSAVHLRLQSQSALERLEAAIQADKQLPLEVHRESDYYARQSERSADFVIGLGTIIAVCFGLGAILGAIITMYASIADRQREIGMLRALGFSRRGIMLSFLLEMLLLVGTGSAIGLLASSGMGLLELSSYNMATLTDVVFQFVPTAGNYIMVGVIALGMGLLGGIVPALRAARISPLRAMRA